MFQTQSAEGMWQQGMLSWRTVSQIRQMLAHLRQTAGNAKICPAQAWMSQAIPTAGSPLASFQPASSQLPA